MSWSSVSTRWRVNVKVNQQLIDRVIRMAWEDRTTFDQIEKRTDLTEAEVIKIMRANLKLRSFRMWRARVTGRITKHGKRFDQARDELKKPFTRRLLGEG